MSNRVKHCLFYPLTVFIIVNIHHFLVVSGGSTQNEQLATIAKFKSGELNLLVATDAAGEGIDIEDCNALITYSHKTNVIGVY